jgi:hypothetical protein
MTHDLGSLARTMILCPICLNKRCPHATDPSLPCTGSNEPGQPGSRYTTPGPGAVYSIGPAVDLVNLKAAMDEFSREPWDLPPAYPTTPTPGDPAK